jgi:hypothetical protein
MASRTGIRNTSQPSPAVPSESFGVASNDESSLISFFWARAGSQTGNGKHEMIEGISQISDCVPNHQTPPLEVGLLSLDLQSKPMFGELVISFVQELVRFSFQRCLDFTIDSLEVMTCPL